MARKNLFGDAETETPSGAPSDGGPSDDIRPLANLERPLRRSGAVGAFSQSLGGISEKAQRAAELEKKLAHGQTIVELDPLLIDSSFVPDRLTVDLGGLSSLIAQIREHGQQVPILVRPHPQTDGRYQAAYGHRRLAAVKQIGGTIKAVIRQLTDEQLVVSQGQENNERTDLSYIEKTFFALRLERKGFSRDIIMASLGVDKAALSRMIALAAGLSDELIEAIGPAPSYGRTRWAELADLVAESAKMQEARALVRSDDFAAKTSDERFERVLEGVRATKSKTRTQQWKAGDAKAVKITETDARLNLNFNKIAVPGFGAFVETRLDRLYDEFLEANKELEA
ncbi:plasmid partitioning protein RepB [Rhizobium sp. 18055]|uniref:plasmid partitioning protein RepB n=1 Tax=Rhizobium sp. 18055 TaxID=2681403 RepID=UPI001357BC62|nr:plasmid partitioning protein RepB [Rhizobium sp. 18055]